MNTDNDGDSLPSPGLAELIRQTYQAIERLDKHETQEYRQAMEIVPGLVPQESKVQCYLTAFDHNPTVAAQRMVQLWKFRKTLFGDRWLLPMTICGAGAMQEYDIRLLKTGFSFFIPRKDQGAIVMVDFSKATGVFAAAVREGVDCMAMVARCGFYTTIVGAEMICRGQLTLLHPITSAHRPTMEFRRKFWDMVRTAFPCRLTQVVVAQSYEEGKTQLLEFLRESTAKVVHFNTRILPLQFHGESTAKTIQSLENAGISRDYVPIELGGHLHYQQNFNEWLCARLSVESFLQPLLPTRSMVTGMIDKITMQRPSSTRSAAHVKPKLLLQREEGKSEEDHCRDRNRLYVRRNYEKNRLKLLSLQGQKTTLEQQNQVLMQQNAELEEALHKAKHLLLQLGI